ncbi:MAG TPA: L-threonylcarbamoyladenylate synthase [Thermoplasmata archaeon]|jgi:tRNA threonylcarbamoyl adenosine modification protein (Sua5/YciO/YrdC/YwlC family)
MEAALSDAAKALRRGRLVVYPTDTLLGLGALASHRGAVGKLVAAKGRSPSQPISVCVSSTEEVERYALVSPAARRFLRRHLPGPFTVLLPPSLEARRRFAPNVGGRAMIGFRVPDHPVARQLAREAGPITATSANRHGAPPARTVAEARRALGGAVSVYLPAVPHGSGKPSTLVDLLGPEPREIVRS